MRVSLGLEHRIAAHFTESCLWVPWLVRGAGSVPFGRQPRCSALPQPARLLLSSKLQRTQSTNRSSGLVSLIMRTVSESGLQQSRHGYSCKVGGVRAEAGPARRTRTPSAGATSSRNCYVTLIPFPRGEATVCFVYVRARARGGRPTWIGSFRSARGPREASAGMGQSASRESRRGI